MQVSFNIPAIVVLVIVVGGYVLDVTTDVRADVRADVDNVGVLAVVNVEVNCISINMSQLLSS